MNTQITKRALLTNRAVSAGLGVGALALLAQRASADTPFTSFAFAATGAPTPRTMSDRLAEAKNVKDFGAIGDGFGFQGQTDTDIAVDNTAYDTYSIAGCRSENSVNFCRFHAGPGVHMAGCAHLNSKAGIFAFIEASSATPAAPGSLLVDACFSQNGIFTGNGTLYIRGCRWGNPGYKGSFGGTVAQDI